jgi:hypothetical protein
VTTGVGVGVTDGLGVGVTTGVGVCVTVGLSVTNGIGVVLIFLYSVKVTDAGEHPKPVEVTVTVTTGSLISFVTVTIPTLSMFATPAEELTAQT